MNIACVYTLRPDWPKFLYVHQALEALGHDCRHVQTLDELKAADAECDLVLFEQRSPPMGAKAVVEFAARGKRAVWAQWWFDLFAEQPFQPMLVTYGALARCMDFVFVKERAYLEHYRALGISAEFLQQGIPENSPAIIRQPVPEFDTLIWGQANERYSQRFHDVAALCHRFRVGWAGKQLRVSGAGVTPIEWTHPDRLHELAARSLTVLSIDQRHDVDGYYSDRLLQATAMGACVLRRYSPGLPDGPYIIYRDHAELLDRLAAIKSDPQIEIDMGNAARAWTLANHTVRQRCIDLLRIVGV